MTTDELLSFNISMLKLLFLWPENGEMSLSYTLKGWTFMLTTHISATLSWGGMLHSLFADSDGYDALLERIAAVIDYLACLYVRYCFIQNISIFNELVEMLTKFKRFCPEDLISITDLKIEWYSKAFLAYWFVGNVMNAIVPLLNVEDCDRISDHYRKRDPCGLTTRIYTFFDVDGYYFWIVYFVQLYACFFITLYVVVVTMTLLGILIQSISQLKYCRKLIGDLSICLDNKSTARKLRLIIIYHIFIIKFTDKMNEAFSSITMLYLTVTSLVISNLGVQILLVDNNSDSTRYLLHLCGWLFLLLLICYYGQSLMNESSGLAEDIYFMNWSEMSTRIQKDIYIIIMRAQKPLCLKAGNAGVMSLHTFLRVINSAYSYFTLLLNVKPST